MKNTALILMAVLLCSCIHEFPEENPEADATEHMCEDILLNWTGSPHTWPDNEINLHTDMDFIIHPYPNRNAPVDVSSSDTTVMVPRIIEDTLRFHRRSPGVATLTLQSCGTTRQLTIRNYRKMAYDFTYNPSSDILGLRLSPEGETGKDELVWMESGINVTAIWCYKVGYGSRFMNTRYPSTTVTDCLCTPGGTVKIIKLQEQYMEVKKLFDKEYETEVSKDPNHAWSSWSGISLEIVIRQECQQLELVHRKTTESVYGFTLGFTFDHTQIYD